MLVKRISSCPEKILLLIFLFLNFLIYRRNHKKTLFTADVRGQLTRGPLQEFSVSTSHLHTGVWELAVLISPCLIFMGSLNRSQVIRLA